jgi:F-box interacting protein
MSCYLPEEIAVETLQRLPVKSLIRFRGVCKSWNSLITSLPFIDSHRRQSIRNNKSNTLLIFKYDTYKPNGACRNDQYRLFQHNEYQMKSGHYLMKSSSYDHKLIGSDNGLICFSEGNDSIFLWNPSIRKIVNLPEPFITGMTHFVYDETFGFDPRTNDYKMVRISIPKHRSPKEDDELLLRKLVEVYSLNTGSWKRFSAPLPPSVVLENWLKPKACLNGSVHFAARDLNFGASVCAFDLRDEVFRQIFPKNMVRLGYVVNVQTCIVSGSLALLSYNDRRNNSMRWERCCSIWVMKEYGVIDSWVKQFTIEIAGSNWHALGFTKNSQIILETGKRGSRELSSYDPETQQATKLGIYGKEHKLCVGTCRENLVLLDKTSGVAPRRRVSKTRNIVIK